MNKKDWVIYLVIPIVLLLAAASCETPYIPKLNPEDSKPMLVVEGQITDQEGPFSVKLTLSSTVLNADPPLPANNADVKIIDDQGHIYHLYGYGSGIYTTQEKNLKGIPGNRYTLMVTTPEDGMQYTSIPVKMQDVPDFDSLYFEQVKHSRITKEGVHLEENWVNVLLDAHDTSGITKFWRWEYEETFQVYVAPNVSCWLTNIPSASIIVANTTEMPVNELKGFIVRSIGPYNPELNMKYSILVRQYSIDADLYHYWKQLKDFYENPGGIYSKIPIPIFGNITCCDSGRKALGYFTASAVKEKRIFISRADDIQMETIRLPYRLCTSWLAPPFWK
jgi:hypothetical protein